MGSDSFGEKGWVKLGVSAALAKEYESDQHAFFHLLAEMLVKAMPDHALIETRGWFSNKKPAKITLKLENGDYVLEDPERGSLVASRRRIVRGIALKTDVITVPEWLDEICLDLESRARSSETARNALGGLLGL